MTERTDDFLIGFGKVAATLGFTFLFCCAMLGVALLADAYKRSNTEPVFTIAPDTVAHHPKKVAP